MSEQHSPQNQTEGNLAEQANPFQGGLVELLSDDRPKFHPRDFRFDIFYIAWLLNWIALAPGGFPARIALFKGWQIVDALGYVFVFAPIICLLGGVLIAPAVAFAALVVCAAANAMGYRRNAPAPGPFDDRPPLFTVTRCLLFV